MTAPTPDERTYDRLDVADETDPVRWLDVGQLEQGGVMYADAIEADVIEKVNAGAMLTYALYHRDAEWWHNQPRSVLKAYMRACKAYGVVPPPAVSQPPPPRQEGDGS